MKKAHKFLMALVIAAAVPAQAGWFDDDDDYVAICKTKALKIKTKAAMACAEGDEVACEAQEAMQDRKYDEEGCKAISITHKKLTGK